MMQSNLGAQCVQGFDKFTDQRDLLASQLSKTVDRHGRLDILHLNDSGTRVLAGLIKHSVFLRIHGGVDKRKRASRIAGRPYNDVARVPPAPRW